MTAKWGIRYVVVAAGTPDDKASDDDIELVSDMIDSPFKKTILSAKVSDKLTLALLQERGAPL